MDGRRWVTTSSVCAAEGAAKARVAYENAKLPKSYATWKLRDVLEDRIAHAQDYVAEFRKADGASGQVRVPGRGPFWRASFACTGCHGE